jgi:phospholipid/cholesterol/gamma-HCH transport system permease protein
MLVELGVMKAEGQVRMLDAQGVDPFIYLVVPRVLALSICMFCLTIVFVTVAMVAGFASGTLAGIIKLTFADFINRALGSIGLTEYLLITAKTFSIGFVVALISCRTALSLTGPAVNVLKILPRGFAKSVLATLMISVALTIVF